MIVFTTAISLHCIPFSESPHNPTSALLGAADTNSPVTVSILLSQPRSLNLLAQTNTAKTLLLLPSSCKHSSLLFVESNAQSSAYQRDVVSVATNLCLPHHIYLSIPERTASHPPATRQRRSFSSETLHLHPHPCPANIEQNIGVNYYTYTNVSQIAQLNYSFRCF